MSEHPIERPRNLRLEIELVDEQARVADLPPAAASHEAPQLLLRRSSLPHGLFLQRSEGSKVSLRVDDPLDRRDSESPDQLVLEIRDAHVEAEGLHVGAREVGPESRALETASEVALFSRITETREREVEPAGAEASQEPAYRLRSPDRHDGDALGLEVTAAALGERFDSALVADAFDQDHRARSDAGLKLLLVHGV